jgi:hypothetical protein
MVDSGWNRGLVNVNGAPSLQPSSGRPNRLLMTRLKPLVASLLAVFAGSALADPPSFGPFYHQFDLTLTPGERTEAFGPFYYRQESEAEKTWAVPPLLSYTKDPDHELKEFDFCYPLLTYDRYGDQYRWQFFQLLNFASTPSNDEAVRSRFTLFPIYFQQRSTDPTQNYTMFVPFYGHLQKRFWREEVFMVMLPFYVQSRKKDYVTDNYMYPFFHLRHGDALEGWQFWPFYGHEHKGVTTRTNGFGDIEVIGAHDRVFVMWPFYFNEKNSLGTPDPFIEHTLFPFYGSQRSPKRDSTTVMWPFYNRIDDREKQYREWQVPWPIIEFARGEGKYKNRVLPFFSHARSPVQQIDTYLWPVYKYDRIHSDPLDRVRRRILYFLYSDIVERNTETQSSKRRTDLLPLFTYRRDHNGNTRLQLIAPLEVFTIGAHKIERDYSPVWSVWRAERNPTTQAASQSLLWNLYRHETAPERKKFSLLFGLFQYQSTPEGKQARLFYIPLGRTGKGTPNGSKASRVATPAPGPAAAAADREARQAVQD